jgi:xanthine dehydrogenase large subunit
MGQGVNTKIRQIVADQFGQPLCRVSVMPTSTEKNNNTSPTAASASTDLNGAAAIDACDRIKERLALLASRKDLLGGERNEIRFEHGAVCSLRGPERRIGFDELAKLAHRERIDLGARGFFATPEIDFNPETGRGTPFRYFTSGCAVAEVSVDRFSGQVRAERVDLLMDIGRPINPGIDRGQVIGAFVQGLGWVTTEELCYSERGELLSNGPSTYKIPDCTDIPCDFRIGFVDNDRNEQNIYRSKGMGEPPLLLAVSVWAAVKHALSCVAAAEPAGLGLPASCEEVLRALGGFSDSS